MTEDALEYFADKITLGTAFYEERAKLIDAAYLTHVEKLAKGIKDEVTRKWFLETMDRKRIVFEVGRIRFLLKVSKIAEADFALEQLRNRIALVDAQVRRPIFRLGSVQSAALDRRRDGGNARKIAKAKEKHRPWIDAAVEIWRTNERLTASSCAQLVIEKLGLTDPVGTVRKVVAVAKPKKVGRAS